MATEASGGPAPDASRATAPPAPAGGAPGPGAMPVDDIVIGRGVVSTGQFVTSGLICVDGTLTQSDLQADMISISQGAEFQGKARARHIEVFGRLSGVLIATEQLVLRASANVSGHISSPCMVMHRGATVTGEVDMDPPGAGGAGEGNGKEARVDAPEGAQSK